MHRFLIILWLLIPSSSAATESAHNLVLVTVDGLRWQEVFRGMDQRLLNDERFTKQPEPLRAAFTALRPQDARAQLLPFMWNTLASHGVLIGNRDTNSLMEVTNDWYFSYPGYNEILTGRADPAIDSNKAIPNPNVTFLEWLNRQPGFRNKVMAFGSWDVFPAIINTERSGIPVNAGFAGATGKLTKREAWLNDLQRKVPSPWTNVRLDAFTHEYALESLRREKPRVLYIAYGETDDFAHDGRFDHYINAAHRFDSFISELWNELQTQRHYRNRTLLIITTDHGRGELPLESWQHHGSVRAVKGYLNSPLMAAYKDGIVGAGHIWFAAIGPGIRAAGELQKDGSWYQNQVAATALYGLGLNPDDYHGGIGRPMTEIFVDGQQHDE
jgi:hypothetical protein